MNKCILALCAFSLLAVSGVTAQTVSITVPNFSFESQTLNNGVSVNNTLTNWTGTNTGTNQVFGVENPSTTKFAAQTDNTNAGTFNDGIADGKNEAFINTGPNTNTIGTITSAAALTTIAANTDYTLTVAVGNALGAGTQLPGSFSLSLLANGVSVATTGLLDGNTNITDGTFKNFTLTLTSIGAQAFIGQDLTIQLGHKNTGTNANAQIVFDNVGLTATSAIPEPSTYAVFVGVMGLGLACVRRRVKRV